MTPNVATHRAVGRERLYELQPAALQQVVGWVEGYRAFWQLSLSNLKQQLENESEGT